MFRCQLGEHLSEKQEKQIKVVLTRRTKLYPSGAQGYETVREVNSCTKCATKHEQGTAGDLSAFKEQLKSANLRRERLQPASEPEYY